MSGDIAEVDSAGVPLLENPPGLWEYYPSPFPSEVKSEPSSSWDSPFEEVLLSEESSPGGEEYPGGALKNLMVSLEAPGFLIFFGYGIWGIRLHGQYCADDLCTSMGLFKVK